MSENIRYPYQYAAADFHSARNKAALEEILSRLTGKSAALLPYDEVRYKLHGFETASQKLETIPIKSIIGSVNRYTDFTRSFLPRQESDLPRWTSVRIVAEQLEGLPPIDVYQIGEAYFVKDGHHRVSVARENGAEYISAYVTKVNTLVPLTPEDKPEDLILKFERAQFLAETHMDEILPDVNLEVSAPGQYEKLAEHVSVHRYYMGIDFKREISYPEAVRHWCTTVYSPIVRIIRSRNILRNFPGRTEADLYLWITAHRTALSEELGWNINPDTAALDFVNRFSRRPVRWVRNQIEKISDWLTPDSLSPGPETGEWRKERIEPRREYHLLDSLLVTVTGQRSDWTAVEYAIEIARREEAGLLGLHIVPDQSSCNSDRVKMLQAEFEQRCQAEGVGGKLVIEVGNVARKVSERSRWADLVVVKLTYPPPLKALGRMESGMRRIILNSLSPVLLVPEKKTFQMGCILLAYDHSPKAREALYVATYMADRWKARLSVLTVMSEPKIAEEINYHAQKYLEQQHLEAEYLRECCRASEAILRISRERQADLILMGGYGASPLVEAIFPSTVDQVLQSTKIPVLICR